jgi:hypothetical protein
MRPFAVIMFGALICCTASCSRRDAGHDAAATEPGQNATPTDEDIARFEALMQPGNQANGKEVRKLFRRCFKKGQPVSRYEKILSRAEKFEWPAGAKDSYKYVWTSGHGNDGCIYTVWAEGYPPVIILATLEFPDF